MSMESLDLLLPPVLYAVVGQETNVYFDNLIAGDASRYEFDVHAAAGRHMNDRWTYVPEQAGDVPLQIEVYDDNGRLLASADTVVRVAATAAATATTAETADTPRQSKRESRSAARHLLFIGDSTTAAGAYTAELLRLCAQGAQPIALVGTKGTPPNVFEGRGGWKLHDYWTREESPFVFDGTFSFARYRSEHGVTALDDVCIHLGINDMFHQTTDEGMEQLLERCMDVLERMIADIRGDDEQIRIGIMTVIPPSRTQDSFGVNYGAGQSRRRYKRNWHRWNRELLTRFAEREGIRLIPLHLNLDTARNMHTTVGAANARNPRPIEYQNNGVHPAESGYRQMADSVYAWLCQ